MDAFTARLKPGRLRWTIPLIALAITGLLLSPLLATPRSSQAADNILWSADMEEGNLNDWYYPGTQANRGCCYGGGEYNSGDAQSTASTDRAHSGRYSLKATIGTPSSPTSGVRLFRWDEARKNRGAYYSGWFYFPSNFTMTANPNSGQFWNLFQFKAKTADGSRVDPLWAFYAQPDGKGGLKIYAGWGWGGSTVAGPRATDGVSGKNYYQSVASLPVGQWVHLEAYLYQSSGFDGQLKFWQDGQQLFDFQNVRTCYDNPNNNSWRCDNQWSLNNYSDGLSPNPATIYIDDAAISLTRLGAGSAPAPSPTQPATATASPTQPATSTPRPTQPATSTPIPTQPATATPIPTSTPVATSTPIPTSTPVATSTPKPQPTSTPVPQVNGDGLTGQYFNNQNFNNLKLTRVDPTVDFDWGAGSPAPGLGSEKFAVRWTGYVVPRYSETYTFHARTDDRVRVWVNDQQIVDRWTTQAVTETAGTIALQAGKKYSIRVDYSDRGGDSVAQLRWSSPSQAKEIIPQSRLFSQ